MAKYLTIGKMPVGKNISAWHGSSAALNSFQRPKRKKPAQGGPGEGRTGRCEVGRYYSGLIGTSGALARNPAGSRAKSLAAG